MAKGFPHDLTATERRVLDVIWRFGPISRAVVAKATGLTSMSVTNIAKVLLDVGLVRETVMRDGRRGQPIRPMSIAADGGFAFGVNFSHTELEVVLINLGGTVLGRQKAKLSSPSVSAIAKKSASAIDKLRRRHRIAKRRIIGVGYAMPGDFGADQQHMAIASEGFSGLNDVDLLPAFHASTELPSFIENDSTAAALGERVLGAGQQFDTFMFVLLGHGVGAGLFLNGDLHRGMHGNAGIIGIHFPNSKPRPSGQDLIEHLRASGMTISDFADLNKIDPNKSPETLEWIKRAGSQLRDKLSYPARLIDPTAIIIGGRLPAHICELLIDEIDTDRFCDHSPSAPKPRIIPSELGADGVLIGAATVPIHRALLSIDQPSVITDTSKSEVLKVS